jgi:hypothetical protein
LFALAFGLLILVLFAFFLRAQFSYAFYFAFGTSAIRLGFLFEPQGFYLYIGITSLCLYNTSNFSTFQDAMLNKVNKMNLYKIQKSALCIHYSGIQD